MPIVLKSSSLKLLETSGPVQVCNGIALPSPLPLQFNLLGLTGKADKQKIRVTGLFFFQNRLQWLLEVEQIFTDCCLMLHIYLLTNKTLMHNSLYVFDNWAVGGI